jgi:archaellum biogenesis ATPase FlaH
MSLPSQTWLIKGVIPRAGTGVIYGDSGAGKTFITIDLSLAVARSISWQGKRVKGPVGVLYVSTEGGSSAMRDRINAYAQYHEISLNNVPFGTITTSVNLRSEDVSRVIDTCHFMAERGHPIGLVVFDTLNQTMGGGDENSSKDMGEYLHAIRRISEQTGTFALVVHHSGKNKQMGARGHSSLRAAIDVEFEVKVDGSQQVLTITKSRDGKTGDEFIYRREMVIVGVDEDLDPIESCVAVPGDPNSLVSKKPKVQGKWQARAYQAISNLGGTAARAGVLEEIGKANSHMSRWKENAQRGIQGCIDGGVFISKGDLLFMN